MLLLQLTLTTTAILTKTGKLKPCRRDAASSCGFIFSFLPLTVEVAERAVAIRRKGKIKLSDAIIKATAELDGRVLITPSTRDFPANARGIRVPYRV